MRNWLRRFGGLLITVTALLYGVPGSIEDTATWLSWLKQLKVPPFAYLIGVVAGVLLGTSEWWWPRTPWGGHSTPQLQNNIIPTAKTESGQTKDLKELESLICRHRDACRPTRNFLMLTHFDVMSRLEFNADREVLVAHLDALAIPILLKDRAEVNGSIS